MVEKICTNAINRSEPWRARMSSFRLRAPLRSYHRQPPGAPLIALPSIVDRYLACVVSIRVGAISKDKSS